MIVLKSIRLDKVTLAV